MTAKNEKKENDRISFDFPNNFNFLSLPPYWFSQLIFQKLSPPTHYAVFPKISFVPFYRVRGSGEETMAFETRLGYCPLVLIFYGRE